MQLKAFGWGWTGQVCRPGALTRRTEMRHPGRRVRARGLQRCTWVREESPAEPRRRGDLSRQNLQPPRLRGRIRLMKVKPFGWGWAGLDCRPVCRVRARGSPVSALAGKPSAAGTPLPRFCHRQSGGNAAATPTRPRPPARPPRRGARPRSRPRGPCPSASPEAALARRSPSRSSPRPTTPAAATRRSHGSEG